MERIPILQIFILKEWDRVNIGFWPFSFAIVSVILGFNIFFLRLFAWVGVFVLLFYALLITLWVKNS